MIQRKKVYILLLMFTCCILDISVNAQELPAGDAKQHVTLYLGGGTAGAFSGEMKDSAYISSGYNFDEGIYLPLAGNKTVSLGLDATVNFSNLNADNALSAVTEKYKWSDGILHPQFEGSTPKASSFGFLIGPKVNFDFSKFFVAPAILLDYQTIKRDAFTISDSLPNPAFPTSKKYVPFISSALMKANGFAIKPTIQLGYHINSFWSVWASFDITFGPSMTNSYSDYHPSGIADSSGAFDYGSYVEGNSIIRTTPISWQSYSVNAGVAYTFGKMKKSTSETVNSPAPEAIRGKVKSIKNNGEGRLSANHSGVNENKAGGQNPKYHPGHVTIQRTKTDSTKTSSVPSHCDTNIDTVTVTCNGFDSTGNMTYAVTVKFSNLLTVGTTYLGSVITTTAPPGAPNSSSQVINLLAGNATISTPTPGGGTVLPAPSTTNINFNITPSGSGPITLQVLSGSIITGTGLTQGSNCPHSFMIDTFPTCICSYCNDSMHITDVNQSATYASPNMSAIHQEFSVAPKNIVKITAEIAYIKDSVTSEDCRVCSQNENEVFQFVTINAASGFGGPIYGNGTALPPSRTVTWSSSSGGVNLSPPNKVNIDLHVGLPALSTLDCCNQWETICIRYTFWDISCKACDRLVCYTVKKH